QAVTRPTHAGRQLVGDDQYFTAIANVAQTRPEVARGNDSARLTLDGFHNYGGDIVTNLARDTQLLFDGIGIPKGNVEDVVLRGHGGTPEDGLAGERERPGGFAMEAQHGGEEAA